MGAESFTNRSKGATADEAFKAIVEQAAYDHGHAGYTGTIAEKDSFIVIKPSPEHLEILRQEQYPEIPEEYMDQVDDKWGPAGCIELNPGEYLFFGWASS